MYQFQTFYREKCRQFYITAECRNYSEIVEHIISNINTLFGVVFQIQYLNDESQWITLSENEEDIKDMFRCSRTVEGADFKRIKIKIVEGCSPAFNFQARTDSSPLAKHPKRLSFESPSSPKDLYSSILAYKSPIELDIDKKTSEISCMEEQLSYYDQEYEKLSSRYSICRASNKQGKQCGKCHLYQGHRKNNCPNDCCVSAIMCGDVSKHLEENNELRELAEKKQKMSADLRKERNELELKKKCADKINSSFSKRIESHLIETNRKKYLVQTSFGVKPRQALLNEHISILERHYKGIFPADIQFEKSRFSSIIERGYTPLPKRPENSVRSLLTENAVYGVQFPLFRGIPTESTPYPPPHPPPPPPPPPPTPPLPPTDDGPCDQTQWYVYPGYGPGCQWSQALKDDEK